MPERALDPQSAICSAIGLLRAHSRGCDSIETRRLLIHTERWLVWMLRCEEGEDLPVPAELAG
ncbi:hypothetical protein [Azospirillum sp. TSO5]|uniref:hypothetical protein n=1 Tax=Azospirillum sp. TSO5 TaxID=716760 RepID=UPI000D619BFE|nr:hypothetical protein [Azospirillum sp. TSO5]PWC92427.1 hypothetical protein TSO5_17285 [Azospirillum sp. TSO5]